MSDRTIEYTEYDAHIEEINEMMRELVRVMDSMFGDEEVYDLWLEKVSFVGDLASFVTQMGLVK